MYETHHAQDGRAQATCPGVHLNTDFALWLDRSPIRFNTKERTGRAIPMDLKLLPNYKREAQKALDESLLISGRVWILFDDDNCKLFRQTPEFAKSVPFSWPGFDGTFGQDSHGCVVFNEQGKVSKVYFYASITQKKYLKAIFRN
jgi:hypothetical protein